MGHAATPSSECPPRTCYSVLEECVLSFLVREFFNATPAFASYNKVDVEEREAIDHDRHRQLVVQVKKAQADFLKAISELGE